MIIATGLPEPEKGEDPDSLVLLVGLDDKYLEQLRSGFDDKGPISYPDGHYVRVILFRGGDDDELIARAAELVTLDERCQFEDNR